MKQCTICYNKEQIYLVSSHWWWLNYVITQLTAVTISFYWTWMSHCSTLDWASFLSVFLEGAYFLVFTITTWHDVANKLYLLLMLMLHTVLGWWVLKKFHRSESCILWDKVDTYRRLLYPKNWGPHFMKLRPLWPSRPINKVKNQLPQAAPKMKFYYSAVLNTSRSQINVALTT